MKLKVKFIAAFVLALLITSLSVAYFTFDLVRDLSIKNQTNQLANVVNLIDINLTTKNRSIGNTLRTAVESDELKDIAKLQAGMVGDVRLVRFLEQLFLEVGSVHRLVIASPHALIQVERTDSGGYQTAPLTSQDEELHLFIDQVRTTGYPIFGGVSEMHQSPKDRSTFVLGGIVSNALPKTALICEVSTDAYYNILPVSLDLLQSQTTFILDQNGRIISANKSVDQAWANDVLTYGKMQPSRFWYETDQTRFQVQSQYNGLTGWRTFSVINEENFFPEGSVLKGFLLNFGVVSSLFSVMLFGLFTGRITNPLKNLTMAMRQARQGDYSIRVEETHSDEIGELNRAYNYLLTEINRLINEVFEEKLALKNSELQALQAQINPHFIYNTLDSINWMLIEKGDLESSRIIQSLGKILRYAVDTHSAFVPLKEEVDNVIHYLIIQKYRLEDRLEYQVALPKHLEQYQVPRLILQPLVENCIKHGLSDVHKILRIQIVAVQGPTLLLKVIDDGAGMDQDAIRQAMAVGERVGSSDHIGLSNVNYRIRLIYGEEYGLTINSLPDHGTTVTLRLPLEDKS